MVPLSAPQRTTVMESADRKEGNCGPNCDKSGRVSSVMAPLSAVSAEKTGRLTAAEMEKEKSDPLAARPNESSSKTRAVPDWPPRDAICRPQKMEAHSQTHKHTHKQTRKDV